MSGHSKFANIKHRKNEQDVKRSKQFVKIAKELTVSVKKGGPDINSNPSLKSIVDKAKSYNMPKENYLRIIKKASGVDNKTNFEEIRYEGHGPCGIAFIINVLSDNKKRTVSSLKSYFKKVNGALAQGNSVLYMFDHKGVIKFNTDLNEDDTFNLIMECAQVEDFKFKENEVEIISSIKDFEKVKKFLNRKNINDFNEAEIKWIPNQFIGPLEKQNDLDNFYKLKSMLDDDEDVSDFFHNLKL